MSNPPADSVRLDRWLWAARFFKTRSLAAEAVSGGKVHLDGHRTKPGKGVRIGSMLRIHKADQEWELEVTALSTRRGPAQEARGLYAETESSMQRREEAALRRREARAEGPHPAGRPSKRDRRLIHRFKQGTG